MFFILLYIQSLRKLLFILLLLLFLFIIILCHETNIIFFILLQVQSLGELVWTCTPKGPLIEVSMTCTSNLPQTWPDACNYDVTVSIFSFSIFIYHVHIESPPNLTGCLCDVIMYFYISIFFYFCWLFMTCTLNLPQTWLEVCMT